MALGKHARGINIITSLVVSLYECIAFFHLEIMSRMRLTHLLHAHSIMLRNLSKIGTIIIMGVARINRYVKQNLNAPAHKSFKEDRLALPLSTPFSSR